MMRVEERKSEIGECPISFHELASICCESMTKPSSATFTKFLTAFNKIPTESLTTDVSNYLIGAFLVNLKSHPNLSDGLRQSLYSPMERLLTQCQVNNFTFFFDIFQHFNMILGMKDGKPTTDFHNNMPEDTTRCVVTCLFMLLKNSLQPHQDQLYDVQHVRSVGHCIYMQLQIVGIDAVGLDIRLQAVRVVQLLIEAGAGDEQKCHSIFNFLPGIVNVLRRSASAKVGKTWKRLIINSVNLLQTSIVTCTSFEPQEKLEIVDQNLSIVLQALSQDLVTNEEDSLRCALLDLSVGIITETESKLPTCAEILWKNILVLSCDNFTPVSSRSRSFLLDNSSKGPLFLCDFEHILNYLKQAKVNFINNNEEESIVNLKCATSSLLVKNLIFLELRNLLSPLASLLTCAVVKNRFDLDEDSDSTLFKLNPMLNICKDLCKNIVSASTLDDIFDELVPLISAQQNLALEERLQGDFMGVIYCFTIMMNSLLENSKEVELENYDLCNIANLYLDVLQSQAEMRITSSNTTKKKITPKMVTILEYEAILLVEGLGVLARIDKYCVLPMVLYSLLEQAGSYLETEPVSKVAKKEIQSIAKTLIILENESATTAVDAVDVDESNIIQDFLSNNLDLIMSELSVRTACISSYPNCPNAITFLANYFDFRQTDFVALIERVFTQSCDNFYNTSSQEIFTKIFRAFMVSLSTHQQKIQLESHSSSDTPKIDTLCTKLLNYQTAIGIDASLWTNCNNADEDNEDLVTKDESESPEKVETGNYDDEVGLTSDLSLSLKICERVLNFLPSSDERSVQLAAIDCLIMGIQILRNHENSLLPLAHTIWQNLAPRFQEKDLVVVRKSFELLLTLCKCSGSFLKKRVVEEVFPKLNSYLMTLVAESERLKPKRTLYYTFTQSYKLQLIILEGLVELCTAIELTEEELDQVVSGCLVYVKPEQHKNLREAALKVVDCLAEGSLGRVIWMKLLAHGLREVPSTKPPHPEFIPINLRQS